MNPAIKDVIEKHVMAYQPKGAKCVTYLTNGVDRVASELGISYRAANELVRSWISETF
jgi:hypothetical protein